ncbi:MAG: hypothetical protein II739_06510 [Clostridia bacterium]|nr:hypothetical protein [Clostridia bacterium]
MEETKESSGWLRRIILLAAVLAVLAVGYLAVHQYCSWKTMRPFMKGTKDGKWYTFDVADGYEIWARPFSTTNFYGEVHVQKKGANRLNIGSGAENENALALFAWRKMSSTDFGILISRPTGSGISAYFVLINEFGDYIREGAFNEEEEAFILEFLRENKSEIKYLISLYHSVENEAK